MKATKFKLSIKNAERWSKVMKYEGAHDTYQPPIDDVRGLPKTGLTDEKARELEKRLYMDEGTLNPRSPYWQDEFAIKISADGVNLDLSDPLHELYYHVLMADNKVMAPGKKRLPNVQYVLINDEQTAVEKNKKRDRLFEAIARFKELTTIEKKNVLISMGHKAYDLSESQIENLLGDIVQATPDKFMSIVEDEDFDTLLFLRRLLDKHVFRKKGGQIFHGENLIGLDEQKAVTFLKHEASQDLLFALEKEVKNDD